MIVQFPEVRARARQVAEVPQGASVWAWGVVLVCVLLSGLSV